MGFHLHSSKWQLAGGRAYPTYIKNVDPGLPESPIYLEFTVITLCIEPKQDHKNNVYNPLSSTAIMEIDDESLSKTRGWV